LAAIEQVFFGGADAVALLIETFAVIVIAIGAVRTAYAIVVSLVVGSAIRGRKEAWVHFASWLMLGLEFELAADIIRSIVAPSWQDIGKLAAIAVIRTFLNVFLARDVEGLSAASPAAR
jgi:uncharacterized membrane protein